MSEKFVSIPRIVRGAHFIIRGWWLGIACGPVERTDQFWANVSARKLFQRHPSRSRPKLNCPRTAPRPVVRNSITVASYGIQPYCGGRALNCPVFSPSARSRSHTFEHGPWPVRGCRCTGWPGMPREFCGGIQLVRGDLHTVRAAILVNALKGSTCIKPAASGWFLTSKTEYARVLVTLGSG